MMHQASFYVPQKQTCDSNSQLVVGEDDNGKFRLERVLLEAKQKRLKLAVHVISIFRVNNIAYCEKVCEKINVYSSLIVFVFSILHMQK